MLRAVAGLQATAGNAAVAAGLGRLAIQRRDGGKASPADAAEQASTPPNPVLAALWKTSVQDPLRQATDAMVDPTDYDTAWDKLLGVRSTLATTAGALPETDPKAARVELLGERINTVEIVLAPRVGIDAGATDERIAQQLGGLEYDAAVMGQALGGAPVPQRNAGAVGQERQGPDTAEQ